MNKDQLACHEAAHAVAHFLTGIKMQKLTLYPIGPDWTGYCQSAVNPLYEPPHLKVVIALAGQFGYQLGIDSKDIIAERCPDPLQQEELLSRMGFVPDFSMTPQLCEAAIALIRGCGPETRETRGQTLHAELQEESPDLIHKHSTSVIGLADELSVRSESTCVMSGEEVAKFLSDFGLELSAESNRITQSVCTNHQGK